MSVQQIIDPRRELPPPIGPATPGAWYAHGAKSIPMPGAA